MTWRQAILTSALFANARCSGAAEPPAGVSQKAQRPTLVASAKPVVTRKPDLVVVSFSASPANPIEGDVVSFKATLKNIGAAATPKKIHGIGFYDSANTLMASSNTYTTSLAAGATLTLVTNTNWTSRAGTFTVTAFADYQNTIAESDETNNRLAGSLTVAAKPVLRPDLTITAISHAPADPIAGDVVRLTATVQNGGTGPTPAGTALTIAYKDAAGVTMASSNTYTTALAAGASVNLVTNVNWTGTEGTQTFTAVADSTSAIPESDESNNTLDHVVSVAAAPVLVPDLEITNVSHSPANPVAGDTVSFTATVRNRGTGPTPAGTALTIAYKDAAGVTMASSNTYTTMLAAGASVNLVTNVNWTGTEGTQTFTAVADSTSAIPESDESNNTLDHVVSVAAAPVLVPDLEITSVSHSPANPVAGDTVSFTATVRNRGTGPTPAGTALTIACKDAAGVTMASSNTYTTVLAAGASVNLVTNVNWTALEGTQTFTAVADPENVIAESDEGNNTQDHAVSVAGVPVTQPDLVILGVTYSPAQPVAGDVVRFTATVQNTGTGPTPAGTVLTVGYLDATGATLAAADTFSSALAAGDAVTITTNTNWTATAGTQQITAVADATHVITESDEANNTRVFALTVSAPVPPPPPPATATVEATPAYRFVDSIGVNTHFTFAWSPYYTRYAEAKARLLELGVRHIRDGSLSAAATYKSGAAVTGLYDDLAQSGIRLDLIGNVNWSATDIADVAVANQASLEFIEGQNEADVFVSGDWVTADRTFQMLLWNTITGLVNPALPVLDPSLAQPSRYATLGDLSPYGDYGNIHSFPGGQPPLSNLDAWLTGVKSTSGSLPVIASETGYHTALKTSSTHLPISERGEAKYVPRLFFDYLQKGVERTYLYQLLDHIAPSTTDPEANFGLVKYDFSVRPAYTSLKNTITLLSDSVGSVPVGGLAVTMTTSSANLKWALLKKTNGRFYLVLWQNVRVWNTSTRKDIVNPDVPVTVTFDRTQMLTLYQPGGGTAPISTVSAASLVVSVPDEIVILEVGP